MIYYVALLESNFSYTFLDSAVDRQRKLIDNIKAQCEDNVALKYLILNGMFSVDKGLSFNEGGGGRQYNGGVKKISEERRVGQ